MVEIRSKRAINQYPKGPSQCPFLSSSDLLPSQCLSLSLSLSLSSCGRQSQVRQRPAVSLIGEEGDMPHGHALNIRNTLNIGTLGTSRYQKFCSGLPSRSLFRQIQMDNEYSDSTRGSLIVLEGLDRSGKTSQSTRLVSYLKEKGLSVEAWRFPDRSTCVGQMISAYLANESQLDDRAIHLLFSANRWEKRPLMESKLKSGTSLVVDRYSYSGVAFSTAKGLDIEWCKDPEKGLIAPDLVLFLNIPPEKAAERGGYGTERYEQLEFQREVAKQYHILRDATWQVIDGCLPVEAIEEQLRELALGCVIQCQKGKPLTNLWSAK